MATNDSKKRKKRKAVAEFSFPIRPFLTFNLPSEGENSETDSHHFLEKRFSGTIVGTSVWIDDCTVVPASDGGDSISAVDLIYRYGCFGKGSLSRSKPGDVQRKRKAEAERLANEKLTKMMTRPQANPDGNDIDEEELARLHDLDRSPDVQHEETLLVVSPPSKRVDRGTMEAFQFSADDDWDDIACPSTSDGEGHEWEHQDQNATSVPKPMIEDKSPASSSPESPTRDHEVIACTEKPSENTNCGGEVEDQVKDAASPKPEDDLPFQERLVLSLEEAFFLHFSLDCLNVRNDDGCVLSTKDLWQLCCDLQPTFVSRYVVYHYFRAKGWVCRPGLKFGVDFLLYKTSPEFYHSEYGVVVALDNTSAESTSSGAESRTIGSVSWPLSWRELIRLERVGESVAKKILLAVIKYPVPRPQADVDCFLRLRQFSVEVCWCVSLCIFLSYCEEITCSTCSQQEAT